MDKPTAELLEAIAEHVLDRKAKADAATSKVAKKTERDQQLEELQAKNDRQWKLIKALGAMLIFSVTGGAGLWGYVKNYGDERVIEATKAKEAAEALQSAAEHIEAKHVDPDVVDAVVDDVGMLSTQLDAMVDYNRQSHDYMVEVLAAGKRKPPKPPKLKQAEAQLDEIGQAKAEVVAQRLVDDMAAKAAKARKSTE